MRRNAFCKEVDYSQESFLSRESKSVAKMNAAEAEAAELETALISSTSLVPCFERQTAQLKVA